MSSVDNTFTVGVKQVSGANTNTSVDGISKSLSGIVFKAHPDNTSRMYVGPDIAGFTLSDSNGWPLDPGESLPIEILNANLVIRSATATDKICWASVGA